MSEQGDQMRRAYMPNYEPDVKWITALIPERINPPKSVVNANLLKYNSWTFWITERREPKLLLVRYEMTCMNREVMADVQAWFNIKFPKDEYKTLWLKPTVNSDGNFVLKAYRILGHHMEEHLENVRKRNEAEQQRKRLKIVAGNDVEPTVQSLG